MTLTRTGLWAPFLATFQILLVTASPGITLPAAAQAQLTRFTVQLSSSAPAPVSGRLLIFAKVGSGDSSVETSEFDSQAGYVAGLDVHDLQPGQTITVIDSQVHTFPSPLAQMPMGSYEAQAVFDPEHDYNYVGREPEDWISSVVQVVSSVSGPSATFTLDHHPTPSPRRVAEERLKTTLVKPGEVELFHYESPSLTDFWGKPTEIRAYVILPPGYAQHPELHYPTVYWTAGFGGTLESGLHDGEGLRERMKTGAMPPMIWVMLDESCIHGTHEFTDSVNNGPWGHALTTEVIPQLEGRYRMDARPQGRLLNGHSSGGWATLQLQINYPDVFGGTWSSSPDPSDFHNFTGPDLYAPNANVYYKPNGGDYPLMRVHGKVVSTIKDSAQLEEVLGPYGGQFSSFEWVFSPRDKSGAPQPMFDRATGAVDSKVVSYWAAHYDLANIVERVWPDRGSLLKGRIHLFVGTADTFYLDGSAHLFEARLSKLGADPHFTYLPGRSHFDVYKVGGDPRGLLNQIAAEMYATARPEQNYKH